LEFPLDILFYNFLTPVVVRYAKPTDGLHSLYKWWFKRCARGLRLSEFLLDEAKTDEQGRHVRRTWTAWLLRKEGDVEKPWPVDKKESGSNEPLPEVYFQFDGRFVRAPASDQIRIQKGKPVFVEVDADNNRLDKKEGGVHGRDSNMVKKVYIPPWFRVRIALFTLAVWLFAATTGLSVTILPLLFGRKVFSLLISNAAQVNDIYAFSLGAYFLGAFLYVALHVQTIADFVRLRFTQLTQAGASTFTILASYAIQALSVLYVYLTTAIGLPLIFAVTLQLYVLMPLHMYFGPTEKHTIHIVQDCTLGILYVRIFGRLLLEDLDSLISLIVESVLADGYLRPRARLATRALFLPAILLFATVTLVPYGLAQVANTMLFNHFTPHQKIYVVRMAYPFVASTAAWVWCGVGLAKATGRWRQRIKDEAYLIGERLHNFGDVKRPATAATAQKGKEKGEASASNARLARVD
jgi:E3 ubiquitin-protein ligase MARCH6